MFCTLIIVSRPQISSSLFILMLKQRFIKNLKMKSERKEMAKRTVRAPKLLDPRITIIFERSALMSAEERSEMF